VNTRPEFLVTLNLAGAVSASTLAQTLAVPFDAELVAVTGVLGTATTTGSLVLDVKKNGSTVYTGANVGAAPATFAAASKVATVSKAARSVSAAGSAYVLGAGGAAYAPGSNVITPLVSDGVPLALLASGVDVVSVSVSGAGAGASDLVVVLQFQKK